MKNINEWPEVHLTKNNDISNNLWYHFMFSWRCGRWGLKVVIPQICAKSGQIVLYKQGGLRNKFNLCKAEIKTESGSAADRIA